MSSLATNSTASTPSAIVQRLSFNIRPMKFDLENKISPIVMEWSKLAAGYQKTFENDRKVLYQLRELSNILEQMDLSIYFDSLIDPPDVINSEPFDFVLVCETGDKVRAIALCDHNTDHFVLKKIATHPDNLIGQGVKGAGTAIILHLAAVILQGNREYITVRTVPGAKDFYQKLGFEFGATENPECGRLTRDKVNELIKNNIPPFDMMPILHN